VVRVDVTRFEFIRLREELKCLEEELPAKEVALAEARGDGDFRENEPYQLARDQYNRASHRIQEIRDILSNVNIVDPFGGTIVPGRLLKVIYRGEADSGGNLVELPEPKEYILVYGSLGESVIKGVLSEDSDLGQQIKNGREGRYFLSRGKTMLAYDIEFLGEEYYDAFLKKFPINSQERIALLLRGES
jgi:hypothetical protein